jgi:hypothetical protein
MPFPDSGNFFFQYDPRFSGPPGISALQDQFGQQRHFNLPEYQYQGGASMLEVPEEYMMRRYFNDLPQFQEEAYMYSPMRGLLG